ncbi:MAG TPA: cyclic nucleotide-binding and patatin-like phospholipase domain-containing protein [Longimicrobium sp.]
MSHEANLELLRDLTPGERSAVAACMRRREVARGEALVREGEPSDALFVVLHGAFQVTRGVPPVAVAQIRAGEVVGEIGFFAGTRRTATVTATRDAAVLELDAAAFARAAREVPSLTTALLAATARRLDHTTARLAPRRHPTPPRTVAVLQGAGEPVPPAFHERLRRAAAAAGALVVDVAAVRARFAAGSPDAPEVAEWLNGLEWEAPLVVYLADEGLTEWTRRCIRQADSVLLATRGAAPAGEPSAVEAFACAVHAPAARRLARVHDARASVVAGTAAWLARLEVGMHHHVALEDDADFHALVRFMAGRAVGFVGGGGGAFGPAHVGIYKAFLERGATFDAFIGTSVGSAMLGGFAMRLSPERLDEGAHDIFVTSRAFKRWTLPRYALLDHKGFDAALARNYGPDTLIEDCWHPFFAVATNLSTQRLELIRSGLMWKAVRASSAIPGLLPPVYTEDGMMLVDGGSMDNAPLAPMHEIKSGPNLVVHFGRTGVQRFHCRYEELPGRWELLAALLNPLRRKRLPRAPGAGAVLMRSLMAHQTYDLPAGEHDLVLRPPRFPGSSFIDFARHTSVFHAAHAWAHATLDELAAAGDGALAAILGAVSPAPAQVAVDITGATIPGVQPVAEAAG